MNAPLPAVETGSYHAEPVDAGASTSSESLLGLEASVRRAGMHLLYLPPYSPDFNPIEQVFSKIKRLLKQMNLRSFNAICDALKAILEKFKTPEYANFIRYSGYVQT